MSQKRDYYEVLGVARGATKVEIDRAYRKLAIKYHPDSSKAEDAVELFKEASEAYEVLSDSEQRRIYDQFGQVKYYHFILFVFRLDAIRHHRHTKRTINRYYICTSTKRFISALHIDSFVTGFIFFPHLGAARSTT